MRRKETKIVINILPGYYNTMVPWYNNNWLYGDDDDDDDGG